MTSPRGGRSTDVRSDWDAARLRADLLRLGRLEPSRARQRLDRWMRPVLALLWVVSLAAYLLARGGSGPVQVLRVSGSGCALVLLLLGFIWLFASGRVASTGAESPTTPLSGPDRRELRRQLRRRSPPDPEHADVLLELAHRQQRLTVGSLVLVAIQLPNVLGLGMDGDRVTVVLSIVSVVIFVVAAVLGVAGLRRSRLLIQELSGPEGVTREQRSVRHRHPGGR